MQILKHLILPATLIAALSLTTLSSSAQQPITPPFTQESWSKDYPPFQIAGNLFYVGTYDLACYLITTPKGHILINTGLAGSENMIRSHVEALGFKFSDIKILLATHAHFDHVGAMAAIQKMTGATVMIHEKDAPILADGGSSDYALGGHGPTFTPVKAAKLLHDSDIVKLGDAQIRVLHHPGHTKGACSFYFVAREENYGYRVLIANMPTILDQAKFPTMPAYPEIGKDFAYTMQGMKKPPFDVWVASHANQFGLHKKHQPGDKYNTQVFSDRKGYDSTLHVFENIYLEKMKAAAK